MPPTSTQARVERLRDMRRQARLGGGQERTDRQHALKKLTAHERVEKLVDAGSFQELDPFVLHRSSDFGLERQRVPGDGVVTGFGRIDGRLVFVYAQDFTVLGGSLSETHGGKIAKIMDMALKNGAPVIGLCDSGGARIQEGVPALAGYSEIFLRNTLASGVVPQITVVMGPCAGGAVYSPALTDFCIMVRDTANMYITGPDIIRAVTHEDVSHDELGGAGVHTSKTGVAHFAAENDEDALFVVRRLLSFLPQNNMEDAPGIAPKDASDRRDLTLNDIVPDNPNRPYDMKGVLASILDDSEFFEVHEAFAQNLIVGFGRLNGRVIGIVAQQPTALAGVLDIDASVKGARFVRFCDCFNIPIVTFEDVPGFLPGVAQEHGGIIRHGAKLLYAYCEATVPKITVITRKAYGGAYCTMNSRHIRGDLVYAWPTAEIAVMAANGAANVVFRREIEASDDPEATRQKLIREYTEQFATPFVAAARGYLDDIIEPADTRPKLIAGLEMLRNKRDTNPPKKHGNIPL